MKSAAKVLKTKADQAVYAISRFTMRLSEPLP